MLDPSLSHIAVGGVLLLITILAYPSQFLLTCSSSSLLLHNVLVALVYLTYYLAITTSPGAIPHTWTPPPATSDDPSLPTDDDTLATIVAHPPRWCSACDAFKPPRAHHCKTCRRCIPKMDHHCPWTANCVGYENHPQFMRFLLYANAALGWFFLLLVGEWWSIVEVWDQPLYLFPWTAWGLAALTAETIGCAITGLALFVLGIRSVINACTGMTTIETWEVEKYEARARRKHERPRTFPFDLGIPENLNIAFGYKSMLLWMWPWATAKKVGTKVDCFDGEGQVEVGCTWEGNGFDEKSAGWPPEDDSDEETVERKEMGTPWVVEDVTDVEGFRRRQQEDIERKKGTGPPLRDRAKSQWRNSEGESLADFGVDDEAEEEDIPLGELMRRRRIMVERQKNQ